MKRMAIFLLLMVVMLAGCQEEAGTAGLAENEVAVYYSNTAATRLLLRVYQPQQTDDIALVQELFDQMQVSHEDSLPAVPVTLSLQDIKISGSLLGLYLSGPYQELTPEVRILCLAAMTRTMTQIDGVDGISVYVDGEPITDGEGNNIGILRVTSFVNNAVDDPEDYREMELTLYFANDKMDKLVRTTRTVTYRSSASLERIVVEQLLQGPEDSGAYATLPRSATLLGVNVRDRICYVNFDDKFITEVLGGYDYIPVYSVVNSLTELPGIDQVQISINGSSEVAFQRDIISFAAPFQKKMDYVEGE